jgi:hypothetical protein
MGDAVLAHLAAKVAPGLDVVFLDTGYHFIETIGPATPFEATPAGQPDHDRAEADRRPSRHAAVPARTCTSPTPTLCCKLAQGPAARGLAGQLRAWATGLRRAETQQRVIRARRRLATPARRRSRSPRWPGGPRAGRAVHRRATRAGQTRSCYDGIPSHRLLAVHPPGRPRARTRAAAAGPAPTRPSAGSTHDRPPAGSTASSILVHITPRYTANSERPH